MRRNAPHIVLGLLIIAFVVTFAFLAIQRHRALESNGMDLGNVDQALWNTAHGDFFAFTNMAPLRNRLALHVEPILLLFVPLYWLGLGGPVALLIVQTAVVGLGAWPLFRLAHMVLCRDGPMASMQEGILFGCIGAWLALVFPLAYLLMPTLESAVLYDFHAVTMAPTFLLFAFHYLEMRRPGRFALAAVLAMACKEDMALTVAMLGLYALVTHRWRFGLPALLGGIVWFLVALNVVQPAFSPTGGNIQATRYAWLGRDLPTVVETLLQRPEVVWQHVWQRANLLAYLGGLLLPTGLLAALSPLTWLPALPTLAVNLLSDNPFTWRLEEFHYAAPLAPFVLVSALWGIRTVVRIARRRHTVARYILFGACAWLLISALSYHYARGFSPLARPFRLPPVTTHAQRAQEVFAQIPRTAALFAQSNLNPHVSGRRILYQDPQLLTELLRGGPCCYNGMLPPPDHLLFDVSTSVNQDDFQRQVITALLKQGGWEPMIAEDGFLLLRATPSAPPIESDQLPPTFTDFARAGGTLPQHPIMANFGDALRLVGFDLHFNRAEEVQVALLMEALRPLSEDYFIALYLLDEWGALRGATTVDQPALVWHPTSRWQVGERVRIVFNTLPWYTRDMSTYRIALGVMRGRDPWQPGTRLRPHPVVDVRYALRLPGDGTLLELARFSHVFGMPEGEPVERLWHVPRPQYQVDTSLGGLIRLVGYDLRPPACDDETSIPVTTACWFGIVLYWQAQQDVSQDYTVFVHVIGKTEAGEERLLTQRDAMPDDGAYPTHNWRAGEVVVDPVRIPLPREMPTGAFDLFVGMYDPVSRERLPVMGATGEVLDDKVVLRAALNVPTRQR
ncbi:MAG: DUF2079 domain-containing protein [Anaerolineae bacterium]